MSDCHLCCCILPFAVVVVRASSRVLIDLAEKPSEERLERRNRGAYDGRVDLDVVPKDQIASVVSLFMPCGLSPEVQSLDPKRCCDGY